MLIPLGFLGGLKPASFELISTTVLASSAASVTFNLTAGQQAAYKHLQVRYTTRSTTTYGDNNYLRFNGDTGSNYSHHLIVGNGTAVNAYNGVTQAFIKGGFTVANDQTASDYGVGVMDILDAFSTTKNKTTRDLTGATQGGGAGSQIQLWSGAWYSTSAISSLAFTLGSGANYMAGTRFSLYGVRG